MKKQPRAITTQSWTARWLVMAYLMALFHNTGISTTWANEVIPGVDTSQSQEESTPEDNVPESSAPGENQDESQGGENTDVPEPSTEQSSQDSQDEQGSQDEQSSQDEQGSQDSQGEQENQDGQDDSGDEEDGGMAISTGGTISFTLPSDGTYYHFGAIVRYYDKDGVLMTYTAGDHVLNITVEKGGNTTIQKLNLTWNGVNVDGSDTEVFDGYLGTTESTSVIEAGSTITITGLDLKSFSYITYEFGGYETNSVDSLVFTPVTYKIDSSNVDTVNKIADPTTIAGGGVIQTKTTFQDTSTNDVYSLVYLLNNYNAISFGDLHSTHVIGPVLVLGEANRTEGDGNTFFFADRTKGVPSYVGTINVCQNWDKSSSAAIRAFSMDYYYDGKIATENKETFVVPPLYTNETDTRIFYVGGSQEYVISGGYSFISPNAYGNAGGILQNDGFFESGALKTAVSDGLYGLWNYETVSGNTITEYIELTTADLKSGYDIATMEKDFTKLSNAGTIGNTLVIEHGKHYIIKAGTLPENIVLDFGETLRYGQNTDDNPTTINFEAGSLITTTDSYTVFPSLYIKDGHSYSLSQQLDPTGAKIYSYLLPTPTAGDGGEFSDLGNKVIWNLDQVRGNMAFNGAGMNIVGHVLAPDADIYKYKVSKDQSGNWSVQEKFEGGNINGMVIANNIYAGTMEFHLWPYMDTTEVEAYYSTSIAIDGEKKITGYDGSTDNFSFILTDTQLPAWSGYGLPTANDTSQKALYTLPADCTTSTTGAETFEFDKIKFNDLADNSTNNFVFYVYEDMQKTIANVEYDETVYAVTVTVTVSGNVAKVSATAQAYNSGTQAQSTYSQSGSNLGIAFTNHYISYDLPATGGGGTAVYTILGLGLICMAFVLTQPNRKETLL